MSVITKWLILSAVILMVSTVVPTIKLRSMSFAFLGALAFGLVNVLFGWLLEAVASFILFLPRILTLGLFGLLIPVAVNMVLLKIVDNALEDEFEIRGLSALFTMSIAVTLTLYCIR
jgi:uncharacterized membrane protein YvlD (DUF360 family)